ncbi:SUKH-3 domain-containing protein [Streptomyces sp. NBC_01089]|uniref:SUKH-3 domain-containing protein n=1 Tax=Streptomyces sp. NBC_01089 TaxID=2903747 RepID=UPI00386E64E9|nr:SUKH-3 domain-containing protein [Streptomyces sp. NBC_01089]
MPPHPQDAPDAPAATGSRFPETVDTTLREAGWLPGRWDIRGAEQWADTLRAHVSPAGHQHAVFPAAVEAWAEFGGLRITGPAPGRQTAPSPVRIDPLSGLHLARTLADLGRALGTEMAPLGDEADGRALLAIDAEGRIYSIDHTGDWYLGHDIDQALAALITGLQPVRLGSAQSTGT